MTQHIHHDMTQHIHRRAPQPCGQFPVKEQQEEQEMPAGYGALVSDEQQAED
jgi:hypothetical protein